MTTVTLHLPDELVTRLEQVADERGQPMDTLVAELLAARFVPPAAVSPAQTAPPGTVIRLRPVRLIGWPTDATFRREEIYGDDAR